jgi:hypothetical protein
VRHLPRGEHDCTGTCGKLDLTDSEYVLSLDDVEELVLIRVDVKRRIERIRLFDDRERTSGGLGARSYEEVCSRERQSFSSHGGEMEAGGAITHDRANLACGDHPSRRWDAPASSCVRDVIGQPYSCTEHHGSWINVISSSSPASRHCRCVWSAGGASLETGLLSTQ